MNLHVSPPLAGSAGAARPGGGIAMPRAIGGWSPHVGATEARPARPITRDRRCRRYRLNVAARVFAGSVGAYGVVATLGMALARALPMQRSEAVMTAILVALLLFPAVTIWAFLARSPGRACGGVIVLTVAFGALAAMLPPPA